MEYSIAGYIERKRSRNSNHSNGKGDTTSYTDSEPCSKKNSVTFNPFVSTTKGRFLSILLCHINKFEPSYPPHLK